ncbi:phosphatidylinositol phosphate synthase [Nocardioides ferulae]|uniref:phosphatidylinositol phosphate synthase n=1 Tax=Nocardioides ferulae TaxID=2340821 RepID=UPI000EB073C3|nr:CDP-alcohol phosphatidyltransferase family protein [Nocardioides ferulae]
MLERFRSAVTAVLSPIARLLLRLGVSPDAVTLVGTLGVCTGALVFFPQGRLLAGVLFITAFVFSDLLDGHMARSSGRVSKFGAFWDSTLDRFGDGAIFIGLALYFAWEEPSKLYLVLSLVCLLMGAITSYARSRGETLGFDVKVGIAERADRLVLILVMTGLSAIFDQPILLYVALWVLAVASTITVGQRVWVVRKQAQAEVAAQASS